MRSFPNLFNYKFSGVPLNILQQFGKTWLLRNLYLAESAAETHLLNSFFTHKATAACGRGCSRKSIRITQFLAKDGSSL